ncbi:HAMP domain-containing sensor histidine kinase [Dyella sp.]|uniref:sensor histidine kinase n=1 Tax=Dyella sp. TaxID=1869338 RepID=UPI002ED505A5
METSRGNSHKSGSQGGTFYQRIALIFGLQLLALIIVSLMGAFNVAPLPAVLLLVVIISILGWMAARREWSSVHHLIGVMRCWDERKPDPSGWAEERMPRRSTSDVRELARGMHSFASRIASYNQREREFTRDASHELRSPLTVIKMSADMLSDESALGEFGQRSVQRIKRASREMGSLVEALLILARESDNGLSMEDFVVNEVIRRELDDARDLLHGRPIELVLEEPASFALHGSPQVFSVLCWQLIRNACQQAEQGTIVVTVLPGVISVTSQSDDQDNAVDRHGFELAIARRISERFAWELELQTREGRQHIARVKFPQPLPANV